MLLPGLNSKNLNSNCKESQIDSMHVAAMFRNYTFASPLDIRQWVWEWLLISAVLEHLDSNSSWFWMSHFSPCLIPVIPVRHRRFFLSLLSSPFFIMLRQPSFLCLCGYPEEAALMRVRQDPLTNFCLTSSLTQVRPMSTSALKGGATHLTTPTSSNFPFPTLLWRVWIISSRLVILLISTRPLQIQSILRFLRVH